MYIRTTTRSKPTLPNKHGEVETFCTYSSNHMQHVQTVFETLLFSQQDENSHQRYSTISSK